MQDALRRSVQVVVLAASQRPHKRRQSGKAKSQRDRDKKEKVSHRKLSRMTGVMFALRTGLSSWFGFSSRNALATTINDDSDMATTAISGVTWPSTATGTAMRL